MWTSFKEPKWEYQGHCQGAWEVKENFTEQGLLTEVKRLFQDAIDSILGEGIWIHC